MTKKKRIKGKKDSPVSQPKAQKSIPSLKQFLAPQTRSEIQSPRDNWLGWVGFAGILILAFMLNFHTLTDSDIFWHLKTGEIIFQTQEVPQQDIYSFTVAGNEWIDAQWIFQLMIYLCYRAWGYAGMILAGAFLSLLIWLLILGPNFSSSRYFSIILVGLISLIPVSIRLKLRPELLTFLFMSLEFLLIILFHKGKKYPLYLLPILLLLWLNSEGLWPIYFFLLGAFFAEEIIYFSLPSLRKWLKRSSVVPIYNSVLRLGIVLLISLPMALLNPYGFRGAIFPLILLRKIAHPESAAKNLIEEFQSPFSMLLPLEMSAYIILMVLSALIFLILIFRKRIYLANLFIWCTFLYLSLTAVRNVALFGIVSAVLMLKMMRENSFSELFPFPRMINLAGFRWLGGVLILCIMFWLAWDISTNRFFIRNHSMVKFGFRIGALPTEYPIRAGAFLKKIFESEKRTKPLKIFADAASAGYLIWLGYPEWKIYFDPRLEVYGEEFLSRFVSAMQQIPVFEQESKRYQFDAVVIGQLIFHPYVIYHLYNHPEWAMVYLDGTNVIFLRKTAELMPLVQKYQIDFSSGFSSQIPEGIGKEWLKDELKNLSAILLAIGQAGFALPNLEEWLKLAPDSQGANYYLGWALHQLGRYQEAKFYLENTLKIDPEAIPAQLQLAQIYARTGEVNRSVEMLNQLLEKHPGEITACINLAQIYEMLLKSPQAKAQWLRCFQIYQSDPIKYEPARIEITNALQRLR